MPVTIKDIAHQVGVSHPTVSRALRGDPLVAPATAARIVQAATDLGYIPSATARSLKTNRSRVLGIIVNRISDPFYAEVLDGVQDVLYTAGYSLFSTSIDHDPDREKTILRAMTERRVDGLIVCSMFITPEYRKQLTSAGPLVVVHNRGTDTGGYAIYHDDREGARQLTRHLIDLGHTRIAFVGNARAGRETQERQAGFRAEMKRADLNVPAEYLSQVPNGQLNANSTEIRALIHLPHPPTALFCFNDMVAINALKVLHQDGYKIPRDFSVVGFDNITLSNFVTPALTTFDQPKYRLGQEAAQMMLRLLENPTASDATNVVTLRGELLIRASTAPPRAK